MEILSTYSNGGKANRAPMGVPKDWKGVLFLAFLVVFIPFFVQTDYFFLLLNIMALNALVVLGLNLLIGSTGQVSLGHAAFYGLGAYLSAIASTTWQWPPLASLAFAILFVTIVSSLLAIPTLRLEGHYLVMATLGFNIIVSILFGQLESVTGGPSGFSGIPRLHFGSFVIGTDRQFYYFIWTVFIVLFSLTLNLTDSRVGRALQAIHDKELTAEALGIPCHLYKVVTFSLSSLFAAFAGFCYAHYLTFISPKTFDIFYSVQVVTMVAVGGMGSLWGGLAGTALLTVLPEVLHRFEDLHVLLYGLILMGVLVFSPQGLFPAVAGSKLVKSAMRRYHGQKYGRTPGVVEVACCVRKPEKAGYAIGLTGVPGESAASSPLLRIQEVGLSFGGLQALQSVSMDVCSGEIVALIGPNGAGKTTLLNVISGLLKPQSGDILLGDKSLLPLAPHQIAARGIGRTFQAVQTFPNFSVMENILLGYHTQGNAGFLSGCLRTPRERKEESELRARALILLSSFNMEEKADLPVQQLGLLEHKLIEVIRALALSPSILLLDEPVGGLNPRESEVLVQYISSIKDAGTGIILVEHDMNVVMRISDRVVVLQHGSRIAMGTPREVQQNPRVIAAYLGVNRARHS